MLERDFIARGMSARDAAAGARRAMGNETFMREQARSVWLSVRLEALWQDLAYALRGLRRNPGFTAAVVSTLTLGIGVNAAMFSLVDRLLFRPPPLLVDPATAHQVYLYRTYRGSEAERSGQYVRYTDLRNSATAFSRMAAFSERQMEIGLGNDAMALPVGIVSASFFGFFDAPPALGRYFSDAEDVLPRGVPVAVLSHAFWATRYGSRASVLDSTLQIGPLRYRIIGISPRQFAGLWPDRPPVAYVPVTTYGATSGGPHWWSSYDHYIGISILARRRPEVSVSEATADVTDAYRRSYQAQILVNPRSQPLAVARPRAVVASVLSARGPEAPAIARVATWLGAIALVVLLIAGANVANLLLARAVRRRREIAVRISLGVSRGRLFAQTLTESMTLATISGVAGLVVAHWAGAALSAAMMPDSEYNRPIADWRTVIFVTVAALVVGMLAGIAPVLQSRRINLVDDLKAGAREGAYQRSRARATLVVAQGALSVALLIAAGLFVQSVRHVRNVRLGYDVEPVLVIGWDLRGGTLDSAHEAALDDRLLAAARSVPGVDHASLQKTVPFQGASSWPLFVGGIDSVDKLGEFDLNGVSPDYFATMGTRILRGRGIQATDDARSSRVMVVGRSMADALWPNADPIGLCVRIGAATAPCTSVVGVAEDILTRDLRSSPGNYFYYLPIAQMSPDYTGLFVRTRGDAGRYVETIRRRLQREMPGAGYVTVDRLSEVIGSQTRTWRVGAGVLSAFGVLALVLASIGLYSVMAYNVTQRTHELGVRRALGAPRWNVVRLVLADGARLGTTGIGIGCGLGWATAHWIEPLLFDESARDPVVFGLVATLLLAVAALASAVPAARAASVDPKRALLAE